MSADIHILPTVKADSGSRRGSGATIAVRLSARDLARLRDRAKAWNMSLAETAENILSSALDPRRLK